MVTVQNSIIVDTAIESIRAKKMYDKKGKGKKLDKENCSNSNQISWVLVSSQGLGGPLLRFIN